MILYEIEFAELGQSVGWFTYDIRANSIFDAACELFGCCGLVIISTIREC